VLKLKRKLAFLFAADLIIVNAALSVSVFPTKALTMTEIFLEPESYTARRIGEVFNVTVNIRNIKATQRMVVAQFRVNYNDTMLKALNVTEGQFLKQFNNAAEAPYTYFISVFDTAQADPLHGPDVLVGILLMPNATGQWTSFPEGNGTLATITFEAIKQTSEPQPPAASVLKLNDTLLVDDSVTEIPHTLANADYQIQPLSFSYEPSTPLAGHPVLFTTTSANYTVTYSWDFGDGTALNTSEPTIGHIYASPGNYSVTLTCTADSFTSDVATQAITVMPNNQPAPVDVTMDVGSIHFRGETAQFSVLTSSYGEAINTTKIEASLYYGGTLITDLSSSARQVGTGYYTIPYDVPADAQPGTYTLVVKAEYYNAKGASLKSFQISPTLTAWNDSIAQITEIQNGVATVSNGITNIKLNLTAINATVAGLITSGKDEILAKIDTSLGTLTTRLDAINATITEVKGNTVTISTALGEVKTTLSDTQSTATTTLYAASILSAIAVILALAILIYVRKK
jgi:PKD repeat protein